MSSIENSKLISLNKTGLDTLRNQLSQEQTQITSQYQLMNSQENTDVNLDTINTNNFNSKIYSSVQYEDAAGNNNSKGQVDGTLSEIMASKNISVQQANFSHEVQNEYG